MTDTTTGTGFPLSYIPALMARETMELDPIRCRGRMTELLGPLIKAVMPRVKLGELCALRGKGNRRIWAEVIGFADGQVMLTPITETDGLSAGAQVIPMGRDHRIQVGSFLLGQVLDGMGQPLADGGGDFTALDGYPVYNDPPNAMTRSPIDKPLITGIRVMDSLLTCGVGQRIGIFAAAGGGKSTLLASLMR
ncbi:MAG: EscN/YscN/HrcN family type III secretion system ATPase, partial [Aquisalimonadaceae bacterium]